MSSSCCDMSCDCLSKYHGRASLERLGFYGDTWAALRAGLRAALRAGLQAGLRAVTVLAVPGRRAVLRVGLPGRATRRAAGPLHARGRGPRSTPDQLQCHRAAGPSDQRTDDADTYQWTSRTSAPGVYNLIHVPYAGTTGSDSAMLESTTHRWTG